LGVQAVVEAALSTVADHPVEVTAAGRTDAGVHAAMQVVHFDTRAVRTERGWVLGATTNLPPQVSALWAREVPEAFHARYSALARTYRYVILNRIPRPALAADRVCWIRDPLDENRMRAAAAHLLGEHDFSSFRAAECQARTPMRNLHKLDVARMGERIVLTVCANAFLHHMVRNIMGCLVMVGSGAREPAWLAEVLASRERSRAAPTFAPDGLYFAGPYYDPVHAIPLRTPAFDWIA
jgi:tRNA pseudouridine38-40 synthase